MTLGIQELQPTQLTLELENIAVPLLVERLRSRGAGHCMRVSDLDVDLMIRLCARLRAELPNTTVVVLTDGKLSLPADWTVSSTKLVELRNPLPDGTQRRPLLVFVPSEVRASAEDSFGVATFEEVSVAGLYEALLQRLLDELPKGFRGAVQESLRRLCDSERPWPFADPLAMVRFLLTAKVNGFDAEALGASLYEIGLVPDFEWLAQPEKAMQRLVRNRECVEKLTWSPRSERGRVGELGLAKRAFRNDLGNFLAEAGADDPRQWARRIVVDRVLWPLAFNKWEFEDGGVQPDSVFISDVQTDLPTVAEDEVKEPLAQLLGQRILPLSNGGLRKFNVTFRVDPHPTNVLGLAKFVVQVISKEQGPIGLARSKAVWKTASDKATISFSRLNKVEWEEGWHFVRVLAQTESGDLIPLVDSSGHAIPWSADTEAVLPRPNESDLFYVLPETDVDVEPAQRAVPREPSALHALFRAQFTAILDGRDPASVFLSHTTWADKQKGQSSGSEMLEVRLGREGAVQVPVSRTLKNIEQKILAAPDGPISWRIPLNLGVPGQSTGDVIGWPQCSAGERFLEARTRYFAAVRAGTSELVTQGIDASAHADLACDYAATYLELLADLARLAEATAKSDSRRAFTDLRKVLALDSVLLAIVDHRGRRREAVLVAPTHPLRALWFATWAKLGSRWLAAAQTAPREYLLPTREALLRLLSPTNFPPVLSTEAGHVLAAVDSINPFWTLFAPSNEEDPRGLVGEVCAALGLPEPAIGGALIDGSYLASRVRRYLVQHPYVRTLTINAFNAGRAGVLGELLLQLQKDPVFADLRYDIRLFVPDPDAPGVGEEIAALLTIDGGGIAAREADAFSIPAESHLYPKLRFAVRDTKDFRTNPESHAAHLSLLFDVFPAEEVAARRADPRHATAFVHGLVQEFSTEYHEDELTVAWRRLPRHGMAQPIEDAEELSDLLSSLAAAMSSATATVATGQSGIDLRPVVNLALGPEDRALLHQVHEVSDWVFTLDRNLGIEFFDHGGHATRPDYLIDHSPDMASTLGHRLVITSRSVAELEALLRPVLEQYGLTAEGHHAVVLLDQLRSLSGRLALKLISSPTQRAEALGLALSRLYLEHQGVFENQIVVPLDAHLELYRVLKAQADELGDEVSFKRTDIGLFDLDIARRTITCRLVEVKCYSGVGDLAAYDALKASIAEQIAQSEQVLAHHFDPQRTPQDRPDRAFKTRELARLLEFYLDRAERYGAITPDAADEARYFLHTLDDGYRLAFTRSALIFDFAKPGTEPHETEGGIEFHRIGVDLIRQLVEAAAPSTDASASVSSGAEGSSAQRPRGVVEVRRRRERAPSVPTLDTAAFLGSPRDRTVSWDELRGRHPSVPQSLQQGATAQDSSPVHAPVLTASPSVPAGPSVTPAVGVASATEVSTPAVTPSADASASAPFAEPATSASPVPYDIMLGVTGDSPQYGLLGDVSGRRVAIDLNHTHTISLFGVQGGGKSYTLGTIAEMASLSIPNINVLPQPLATVIFHYSPTMDYRPEFTSMVAPNSEASQVKMLKETFGAEPRALRDVLLLAPADKLEERKREYPDIEVRPLKFGAAELQTSHWRFLMGAVGNQATYIRQLNRVMKSLRDELTLDGLNQGIEASSLPDHLKGMAKMRLELASEYIDDSVRLRDEIRPGRLVIVDLRDEFIEKDEALGLFVVLLQLFADAKYRDATGAEHSFNKLVVFDEAHKYIESPDLVAGLIEVVREMRHKGTSIMVASQDPPSVPVSLIELSSQIVLHKFNSPAWLKHIQKANAALGSLSPERMANLRAGEAFVWSSKATDEAFTKGAVKIRCRPRVTSHGGATKTAVK